MHDLVQGALEGAKYPIARLISLFEDSRASTALKRSNVLSMLANSDQRRRGYFPGITGTPGAGKSTLTGELALRLIAKDPHIRVAVLAVDPSSHVSGGSILGDRTRVSFPIDEKRLFFRSQASDQELGGVSRNTFQVCRLLHYLFDIILIETVGIGQNEIEIQHIADRVYLILQPMAGDQIQFMKAGIMEIPDVFVLNKCDEEVAARKSYYALKTSLAFARPNEEMELPIYQTSARTGLGLDKFADDLLASAYESRPENMLKKEEYFLLRWIRDEYGRHGIRFLQEKWQGSAGLLKAMQGFEAAQIEFASQIQI